MNNTNDQILTSVSLKVAGETSEKGAKPEDIIAKAQTIYRMHIAWLERLKKQRENNEPNKS